MAENLTASRQSSLDEGSHADGSEEVETPSGEKEFLEERLELIAPEQCLWYHGRLDRAAAEDRLLTSNQVGSYLVRESESKPGSFVLSYLDSNSTISHFRIIAMCGEYYIGGRQFDSLSDLIGYYTSWSCILKGERLEEPVPPPQPVDDRRRVMAILSSKALPDTDQISFENGDIFVVTNELNEWLWVISKNNKSGLVPAALMENLDSHIDPVEALPYFHSNITKEMAIRKLQYAGHGSYLVRPSDNSPGNYALYLYLNDKSGPFNIPAGHGSYLVRPSDNSPGNYALFFLCDKEVTRFRIEKKDKLLHLGGRYFHSLQAIIERYTNEEIVTDYKLITAVHRDNYVQRDGVFQKTLSTQQTNDIYESIPHDPGPNLLSDKDDNITLRGYLLKRSEKTKKWKQMYFMLNGTAKHLLNFENDKRSKPKGIVEFSYSSLYPVHDSYFERPYCFQLVSEYNNNQVQTCYLCAENLDAAQRWYQELKHHCVNTCQQSSLLTKFSSLNIHIIDAQNLHLKVFHHPYCYVSLDNVKVCRTTILEDKCTYWGEEFLLDDIPITTEKVTIVMCNKGKRSNNIAQVTINICDLKNNDTVEEKYVLQSCNPATHKGDLGTLRIKTSYSQEIIMPQTEYISLKELLIHDDYQHLIVLAKFCQASEWVTLSKACIRIYRCERQESRVLKILNDLEIKREEEVSTLFRASSFTTCMMDQYMRMTCTEFVHAAVKDIVHKIMDSKQSCELDPARMDTPAEIKVNTDHLLQLLNETLDGIFKSTDSCPTVLRQICHHLQVKAKERWPRDDTVKTRVVSAFIFLRLLCPAIVNPKLYNLVSENPSDMAYRTLKLVAKVIQNLANLVDTGAKEGFMEAVQPFIKKNRDRMVKFLDELSNMKVAQPMKQDYLVGDLARDLATVHQMAAAHLADIQTLVEQQPCIKKLVIVITMLTEHKENYIVKNS